MWYQQDEDYRLRVTERDWNELRQGTALRRQVRAARKQSGVPSLARRAILYLVRMFSPYPVATTAVVDTLDHDDAEIARLLSLLAPDGRVLRVENIERLCEVEDEPYCRPIA